MSDYPPSHCLKVTECDQHCRDRSKLSSSHFSWSSEEAFKVMVMTPPSDSSSSPGSPSLQPMLGVPRAELYARPNSHPFQNRVLLFTGPDQQIKVGRSVARCQSYKTIFSSSLTEDQNKLVFVPVKPFQPSLMFASKVRRIPKRVSLSRCSTHLGSN